MKIILIRHGDAGAYTLPDNERNLSELGKAQATATGQWLCEHQMIDVIISSPYNRAMQTAKLIESYYDDVDFMVCDVITPNDDAQKAIQRLAQMVDDFGEDAVIAVVCHMNIIAKIQHILCQDEATGFALAEARVLSMPALTPAFGSCEISFVPRVS